MHTFDSAGRLMRRRRPRRRQNVACNDVVAVVDCSFDPNSWRTTNHWRRRLWTLSLTCLATAFVVALAVDAIPAIGYFDSALNFDDDRPIASTQVGDTC